MGLIKKFKQWRTDRRNHKEFLDRWDTTKAELKSPNNDYLLADTFTREEMLRIYQHGVDKGYNLGYSVGRNEGIAFAKEAAINNLKEIIWQQNKKQTNHSQTTATPTVAQSQSYDQNQTSASRNAPELTVPGR